MGLPVQLNYYSNSDVSLIDLMNTADGTFIGKHQVSLTNYDNTSLPAVAIGSIVEVNGTLYKFTTESAISGSAVDGTNYILLVPSGDPALGTATVTPTWSQTSPTWSDSKQGWYGTGGSANYRYLEFKIWKSSALYPYKYKFINDKKTFIECTLSGDQTISTTDATTIAFNQVSGDTYSQFNTSSSSFTTFKDGIFCFSYRIDLNNYETALYEFEYFKNGSEVANKNIRMEVIRTNEDILATIYDSLSAGDVILFKANSQTDSSYTIASALTYLNIIEI